MKMSRTIRAALAVACFVSLNGTTAFAAVILDHSPDAVGGTQSPAYANNATGQNFGDDVFTISNSHTLSGMDLYVGSQWASLGQSVTIRIWADGGGTPSTLLHDFTETISILDTDGIAGWVPTTRRAHVDFTPAITLNAGTYWIGMSGTNSELSVYTTRGASGSPLLDGKVAQFSGTTYSHMANIGDTAMRLYGDSFTAVPEPASIAMWGLAGGLGLVVARRRRKSIIG